MCEYRRQPEHLINTTTAVSGNNSPKAPNLTPWIRVLEITKDTAETVTAFSDLEKLFFRMGMGTAGSQGTTHSVYTVWTSGFGNVVE